MARYIITFSITFIVKFQVFLINVNCHQKVRGRGKWRQRSSSRTALRWKK